MPELSIITINRNNAKGLQKTMHSVFSQSFTSYEYIIVDGASTDESVEEIKKNDHRLQYWISEQDKGIYNAMNKGILQAKGNYLLFLNSGDILINDNILQNVFQTPRSADIVYGDLYYLYADGSKKLFPSLNERQLKLSSFFTDERSTISHPAAFIKRNLFESNLYDESYRIVADNKFFIEQVIIKNCTVDYINIAVSEFDATGISSMKGNFQQTIQERKRIFRELVPERILADYGVVIEAVNSPLLPYLSTLNKTSGLNKLVSRIVSNIIKIYSLFRKVKA